MQPSSLRALWAVCQSKIKSWTVPEFEMKLALSLQKSGTDVNQIAYMRPMVIGPDGVERSDSGHAQTATASNHRLSQDQHALLAHLKESGRVRGRVLEVRAGGKFGFIRPESREGDQEIYFGMEDCKEGLVSPSSHTRCTSRWQQSLMLYLPACLACLLACLFCALHSCK